MTQAPMEQEHDGPELLGPESSDDSSPAPEDRAAALEAELAELKDRYLRLAADYDNSQKRMRRDVDQQVRQARHRGILQWLPVVDAIERALESTSGEAQAWIEGTRNLHRLALQVLSREGVKPIEARDLPFDPRLHEAVGVFPVQGQESGQVAYVQQTGYLDAEGHVIRPAQVLVTQ